MNHSRQLRSVATALCLTVPVLAKQTSWTLQAPKPTGVDLHDVQMLTPTEGWAIGDGGILLHTLDAGATWGTTHLDTDSTWTLFFLDAQHGWAAGNGFFHTVDGGAHWFKDNAWGSIYDIFFLDASHGWACGNGGTTYRTTDGGLTWSWSTVEPITTLSGIHFPSLAKGWTVNIDGEIYASTDGGASWTLAHQAGAYLASIQFLDPDVGWAIGGNTFLRTLDGGASWQKKSVPPGTWAHAAFFSDPMHGWAVGDGMSAVRTTNGGATWQRITSLSGNQRLWSVGFADASTGMIVGETGILSLSSDGGLAWTPRQSGGAGATYGMDAVDATHAWSANDAGEVLHTTDGSFWVRSNVPEISVYGRVEDVDFVDTSVGWAVATDSAWTGDTAKIARSNDGGLTWDLQFGLPGDSYGEGIEAIDSERAFAIFLRAGVGGLVVRTTDGGTSWTDVSPSAASFFGLDFIDANRGWLAGGLIYRTIDGGNSWQQQYAPLYGVMDISFLDSEIGWAVGWYGTILHTTNGGQTWVEQQAGGGTTPNLLAVQALTPMRAWIAGSGGYVARTNDGGQTWVQENAHPNTYNSFSALAFLDPENGWVGGSNIAPDGGIWMRGHCPTPDVYCIAAPNSSGAGARIYALGSTSLSAANFGVGIVGGVPGQPGLFYYGPEQTQLPFGNGYRCVAAGSTGIFRLPPPSIVDHLGIAEYALDFSTPPAGSGSGKIEVGSTWNFQFWYRDPMGGGSAFNLSDALSVTFCP
jgi:photosystem II stability/assembly factor-like uncharacterized protein